MSRVWLACAVLVLVTWVAAGASAKPRIEKTPFGKATDGAAVDLYTLTNSRGMTAKITNYGAILVALLVPDRQGKLDDVVLGYDDLGGYLANNPYFGAVVGRYGNRIARGQFAIDGKTYTLTRNDGENHLHGGAKGFDKVLWTARSVGAKDHVAVVLSYHSPDGEEGYPGALSAEVTYMLTEQNELRIEYKATTDRPTIVNLTHHSYFNLDGAGSGDILGHKLTLHADRFTPVIKGLIPTGEVKPVAGTPMDFTRPAAIGTRIDAPDEQLALGGGYDHNWVLNRSGEGLSLAATLIGPTTGRVLEILTTEPAIQFYSGNFLDGSITGKAGRVYRHRFGLCLEPQHSPDSPNRPDFPTTVLRPGETYRSTTVLRFSVVQQ